MNSEDYNPEVLTCLANLSNDEVFAPPNLVNEVLDMLPQELFKISSTTFLDPITKSGVFKGNCKTSYRGIRTGTTRFTKSVKAYI